jgi:hypothetical protein
MICKVKSLSRRPSWGRLSVLILGPLVLSATLWGPASRGRSVAAPDAPNGFWGRPAWGEDRLLAPTVSPSPGSGDPVAGLGAGPDSNPATNRLGSSAFARRYLRAVGLAESGLSERAHAATSSAAGPYQFIDQTWLRVLRAYGPGLGLAREAALVRLDGRGLARVADPDLRSALLALRYDPEVARLMTMALTQENAGRLRAVLARAPTAAELYAAHLFGPAGALALLSAVHAAPDLPACEVLPAAAASNRPLFYSAAGPRSARGLFALIALRASRS